MEKVKLLNDCIVVDDKILVISDLHIGYEENLENYGLIPRYQYKEIIEKISKIFEYCLKNKIKLEKIVILGDLKHEFGEISDSEWRETLGLLDFLLERVKKIILIKGNHDTILGPIAKKREIEVVDYYSYNGICYLHGDKVRDEWIKDCNTLMLGHLHPAITLRDDYKKEKYKCFLKGKWNKKMVYVLPSFIPLSFGFDLINIHDKEKEFFIINEKDLKKFSVIIYNEKENKEYDFGKLGNIYKIT